MEGCKAAEISLLCVFFGGYPGYCTVSYLTPLRLCRNEVSSLVCKRSSWIRSNESKSKGVVISTTSIAKSVVHQGKRGRSTPKFVQVAIGEPDQVIDDLLDSTVVIEPNHKLVQRHAKIRPDFKFAQA